MQITALRLFEIQGILEHEGLYLIVLPSGPALRMELDDDKMESKRELTY